MRVVLEIDNRVRLVPDRPLPDAELGRLRGAFTHTNPKFKMLAAIGRSTWGTPPEFRTWSDVNGALSFARGGLPKVRAILQHLGHHVVHRDCRETGDPDAGAAIGEHLVEPWTHQVEGADLALARTTCLVIAGTGSGKTGTAIRLISLAKVPTIVVVNNAELLHQWSKRVRREMGLEERDVGIISGSKRHLRPVTLAMAQTLYSQGIDPALNAFFGMVIVDEVHRSAAPTIFAAVDPFRAKWRVGFSADWRRKDRLEFLIRDLFGDVAHEVSQESLIASGYVLDVEIRVVPTEFRAPWYGVEEKMDPSLFVESTEDLEREPKEVDLNRLRDEMQADETRNALATWCALEELRDGGGPVAIFSHRREHCLMLARGFTSRGISNGFLIGGADYKREFRATLAGLEAGDVRVGVGTYEAFGTGMDLPALTGGVAATPIAANKQFTGQVRGRLCRISFGKSGARLWYLWDRHVFPKHLTNLIRWNKNVVVREPDGSWTDARVWRKRARAA